MSSSPFPYSLSRRTKPKNRKSRLSKIEDTVNRTEVKIDDLSEAMDGTIECLSYLCGNESPIMNTDKVKFKVIL